MREEMDKKLKEGVSVQELENFGKKYHFEIFFACYFVLATLLTFRFFGVSWSIFLAGVGGVLGIWLPHKVGKAAKGVFRFVYKQEKVTKWILAVVGLVIAFFLPPLIFFFLGLFGAAGIYREACAARKSDAQEKE